MELECLADFDRWTVELEPDAGDVEAGSESTVESWNVLGAQHWRGLPGLSDELVNEWQRYSAKVGQPLTREGLELWMVRSQSGQCVVCGKKAQQFCKDHR